MIFMTFMKSSFHAYPHRFFGFDNTSIFRLVLSNSATSLPVLMKLKSTRRCSWHRNFPCSTRLFHDTMNSSSSGSMKKIPRNLLALSSFGFSIAHFSFSLRFDASDICFHISGHSLSSLEVVFEVVCFLVNLTLAIICQDWRSFVFLSVSHRTTYTHLVVTISIQ